MPQYHVVLVKWVHVLHLALIYSLSTLNSGNKARDGYTLCTTKEAMVMYIGTNFGEDTSKEFITGVPIVLIVAPQDSAIIARHNIRLKVDSILHTIE